jgi:hypothetical protein
VRVAAIVLFGLLAVTGATVPMILAGSAGAAAAFALRVERWVRPAQAGAVGAAVLLVVAGALLAPAGAERVFVIVVDLVLGGLLVAFVLLAGSANGPGAE